MSFERQPNTSQAPRAAATGADAASAGKQPRVPPVELPMRGPGEAAEVHAAAEHGTSGPATRLPFLDQIQHSFGRHDAGAIRAHVGGPAAEAASAMGADAFATGDRVAFAGAPDLHTAAHEAAHVVQQRGGVQLAGGVGEAGDPHERHADAVADLVVQGQSSEALLDPYARAGGSRAGTVQRHAFIHGKQVLKTDALATGAVAKLVTDDRVRDYVSADELKRHAAGQTDYLGNLSDDVGTWVRFSPTGINVLGEVHETDIAFDRVGPAVGAKSFIHEGISTDQLPAGSAIKQEYDAGNAERYKTLGIDHEKDKSKFGAESLLPKIGFAMSRLMPYLQGTLKLDALTTAEGIYEGTIYQRFLKVGWAYGKDVRIQLVMMGAAMQLPPPRFEALGEAVDALRGVLDPFVTALPEHGNLGDELAKPAHRKLLRPLERFAQAFIDAMIEQAIVDPSSRMSAKQKKQFEGGKTTQAENTKLFTDWRNFEIEDAVNAAAARGVRYAAMGLHHLYYLQKTKLPSNAHIVDMGDEGSKFEDATRKLKDTAVPQ
jgi:Domain of unknown function (DUF4157)